MSEALEDDDWQPPTESELKVFQARRERSDRISKLMGDYLLKGYKMLGVCCAICETILLQDKQGVNYCVACKELDADNVKDDPALSAEAALSQAAEIHQRSTCSSQDPSPTEHRDVLDQNDVSAVPELSAEPESQGATASDASGQKGHLDPPVGTRQPKLTISRNAVVSQSGAAARGTAGDQSEQPLGAEGGDRQGTALVTPDLTKNMPKPPVLEGYHHRIQAGGGSWSDVPGQECSGGVVRPRPESSFHGSYPRNVVPHAPNHGDILDRSLTVLYYKIQRATVELEQSRDVQYCTQLCLMIKNCAEALEALNKVKNQRS